MLLKHYVFKASPMYSIKLLSQAFPLPCIPFIPPLHDLVHANKWKAGRGLGAGLRFYNSSY